MQINYNTKGKHLTEKEQHLIEKWKKEGKSTNQLSPLTIDWQSEELTLGLLKKKQSFVRKLNRNSHPKSLVNYLTCLLVQQSIHGSIKVGSLIFHVKI